MDVMNAMLSSLHLVYPPVSSFEAERLKNDAGVEEWIRRSDFYMMAMRPEVFFDDVGFEVHDGIFTVPLIGEASDSSTIRDEVVIDIAKLVAGALDIEPPVITAYLGPKLLQFWAGTDEDIEAGLLDEPFAWFTIEKLLYDAGRGLAGISGLDRHRDFARYELLYVGIAKKTDTFDRLFKGAHNARQQILSNEWPRRVGSRVTDELILFPFRVEPLVFRTLAAGDTVTATTSDEWKAYMKRVVADAEKAFVHLLDPRYNVEKFVNYPKGADGVYGEGHQRYGYVIAEDITFVAPNGTMRGSLSTRTNMFDNSADSVFVEGDLVELHEGSRPD